MTISEITSILAEFPRKVLFQGETPLARMPNLEKLAGTGPLYVKRDDLNGIGPGGNKVRPLEYLLGEAVDKQCNIIIASGQENSNLCSIAASSCCKLGLKCILVHNNEPPKLLSGNILLNRLSGVNEHYIGNVSEADRNLYVENLTESLIQEGKKPYVIKNGATTIQGAVGYIHLPIELMRCRSKCPVTDLFVPGGNGGLAAGVVLGTMMLDAPFHVHVITVEHTKKELEKIMLDLIGGMEKYLDIAPGISLESVMTIHEEYRGEGWGISTEESDNMIRIMAESEGIFLERIYTSKTFLGMFDLLKTGKIKTGGACVVHSGGFASLFHQYLA